MSSKKFTLCGRMVILTLGLSNTRQLLKQPPKKFNVKVNEMALKHNLCSTFTTSAQLLSCSAIFDSLVF